MKKKITGILLILLLCFTVTLPIFGEEGFSSGYDRLLDTAGLLSDSENADLLAKLNEISERQSVDVVVVTTEDLEGYDSVSAYAEAVFEDCDYGYGSEKDGVLLLISMADRDWYIATHGYGITAFTDAGISYIGEKITSDLSDGDYAAAFTRYAELCDDFISQAKSGAAYDNGSLPREPLSVIWIPVSLVIGLVLALITVGCMKAKLKTVRRQAAADSYVKKDSMNVTESRDLFLYRTVTRTAKPKNEDNGSSSGSSTHTSSSGSTYGGGGGKF